MINSKRIKEMIMFCPQCKCEYLEGITECADCGIPLVERLPEEETTSKEFDPMEDLVTIKKFSTNHEAEVAKGFLLANGINAVISNDDWMGFRGGGVHLRRDKIRLLIKKIDVPEAEKIFREMGIPTQKEIEERPYGYEYRDPHVSPSRGERLYKKYVKYVLMALLVILVIFIMNHFCQ
jgi:hypothetical protein